MHYLLIGYMLVQFQKTQPIATYVQNNLNASNRQMLLGDLSHIIISKLSTSELACSSILSISSFRFGNNSLLSSSVTLSVSYLSPSDSTMSSLYCLLKGCNQIICYMVCPTQQQSLEVIQLS